MAKPRLLLLCGGQSDEHEVSLASARSVIAAAAGRFEVVPRVIGRSGQLLGPATSRQLLEKGSVNGSARLEPVTEPLARLDEAAFDVVFPLLHGPFGEDGTVQGLLKLLGVPFVGSGVLGSAVGMDKPTMKAVFAAHGFPQVPHVTVRRSELEADPEGVVARVRALGWPVFVKPANLGSSVGIAKASDERALVQAMREAARFDRRLIVERAVIGARELEVGVLGNDRPEASPVGEISYKSEFYDYATKYTEGCAELAIPARVPEAVAERCRALALEAFKALDGAGLARVDFFYLEATGELLLNEINTMPGFTTTSMYPKLWEAAGLSYAELIARLVELALERR